MLTVETPRLLLRPWKAQDAPALRAAIDASLPELAAWMPWAEHEPRTLAETEAYTVDSARRFAAGEDYTFGVFARSPELGTPDDVLGGTGLHRQMGRLGFHIGYWIRSDATDRGLATEAAAAMVKLSFELHGMSVVEITCDSDNLRSIRVAEKLGFVGLPAAEGEHRRYQLIKPHYPRTLGSTLAVTARDDDDELPLKSGRLSI